MNKSILNKINLKNLILKYRSNTKIQFFINIVIIIILIILIRIFKGPITIQTKHNTLNYNIYINTNEIDKFQVDEKYKKTIIPSLIYQEDYTSNEYSFHTNTYFTTQNKYKLKLEISKCIKDKNEIDCLKENDKKSKIKFNKDNFNTIIEYKEKNKIIYQGKYIEDITEYISQTGNYHITLEGKINNITTKIEFAINIFN